MLVSKKNLMSLPDGRHPLGNGLYLVVNGSRRSWSLRLKIRGRWTWRGLGSFEKYSYREACQRAKEFDPDVAEEKKLERRSSTFSGIYEEAIDGIAKIREWKRAEYRGSWKRLLDRYAVKSLGRLPVSSITRDDILEIVSPIWEDHNPTAKKVLHELCVIFDWCSVHGIPIKNNPAKWEGNLDLLLSKEGGHQIRHYESIGWQNLPELFECLWEVGGLPELAVMFGTLTGLRASEFTKLKWEYFDGDVILIPRQNLKVLKYEIHRVPVSSYARRILDRIERVSEYVFPSTSNHADREEMHRGTPNAVIRRFCPKGTMHGMRSAFQDWSAEHEENYIASEKALGHTFGNQVTQSYLRTDMLKNRTGMMERWGQWCFSKIDSLH